MEAENVDTVRWEDGRGSAGEFSQDFGETFGVLLGKLEHKHSTNLENEPNSCLIAKQVNGNSQNDCIESSSSVGESGSPDQEAGAVKKEVSPGDETSVHPANEDSDVDSPLPAKRQRFYFESDALALKNNPDYQNLLKTLATLEAQKVQAIKDLETLVQVEAKAEKDPHGLIEALKNGSLDPLPTRQQVAELPEIKWKGYMDSLQLVAKQHSSVYLHTRHQKSRTLMDNKMVANKPRDLNKSLLFRQSWTPEEQARLEELLRIHPPEAVEQRRFEKIAHDLGTRTTQQVASHVQKYFIKLARAGLPVPGRTPNLAAYTKRKKGSRTKRGLNRPSTFFSSLVPKVYMSEGGTSPSLEWEDSSDEDSVVAELIPTDLQQGNEDSSTLLQPVKCSSCGLELTAGIFWQCTNCPEETQPQLCANCINSDYSSGCHSPSHHMQLLPIARSSFTDKDYTGFTPRSIQTQYNYLDPNFYPAS